MLQVILTLINIFFYLSTIIMVLFEDFICEIALSQSNITFVMDFVTSHHITWPQHTQGLCITTLSKGHK